MEYLDGQKFGVRISRRTLFSAPTRSISAVFSANFLSAKVLLFIIQVSSTAENCFYVQFPKVNNQTEVNISITLDDY